MRQGQGTIKWSNGDTYVGQFEKDLPHGNGTIFPQYSFLSLSGSSRTSPSPPPLPPPALFLVAVFSVLLRNSCIILVF